MCGIGHYNSYPVLIVCSDNSYIRLIVKPKLKVCGGNSHLELVFCGDNSQVVMTAYWGYGVG